VLHDQVWDQIDKALPPGTTTVIISPDAELSFVSFATLLSDDRLLGERYSIRYVASGRDLLRETKSTTDAKNIDASIREPGLHRAGRHSSAGQTRCNLCRAEINCDARSRIALPTGVAGHRERICRIANACDENGLAVQAYLGPAATEAELRKSVHRAFCIWRRTDSSSLKSDLGRSSDAPQPRQMFPRQTGQSDAPQRLAVASAQTTLRAWAKGEVPPTETDGVITAEEVGGLRLDGTWLVVLSACDTGSGEAKAGEGVMGLRRGFVQAGAQNLLMTLWPISDETTVQIMLDFYDDASKTGNAPQALADTQRAWLVKLRKERGLLPAVRFAGPFIMSSQGRP
jgi:hypothetical protein